MYENARLKKTRDKAKSSLVNERSTFLVGPSVAQPSSSLMIPNQERNAPPEFNSCGETLMINERSPFFSCPPVVQPSSSLMISNQGRNVPPELDSDGETFMMDEISQFLVDSPIMQPSSSLMISNQGKNVLPELDSVGETSMMNERSPYLVGPPVVQPSSSLLISNEGRNAPPKLDWGGDTSMMNERSTFLVDPPVAQPSSLMISNPERNAQPKLDSGGEMSSVNKKSMLEFAIVAMNELIMLGETNSPLWRIDSSSKREILNYEEYKSFLNNGLIKPPGYVMEASRETGSVLMDSLALVRILTTNIWVNVFAPMVSVASTQRLIPIGSGGPRSGSLKLIEAQFQVISPLVPKRQVKFLRYCKKLRKGLWVIVDVTPRQQDLNLLSDGGSNRLPSGVIIEDLTNGSSKVTWIEQAEYDESQVPQLYQLSVGSGIGLGAKRWLTTLQRYCENLSILSSINLAEVYEGMSTKVATEIVKLAQRMTLNYYSGITDSSEREWERSHVKNENMRLLTRKNVNVHGEHTGIVLNASTSVWFPVSQRTMFDFLSNLSLRDQWDILTSDTSIEEKFKIRKSSCQGNCVSLLRFVENGEKEASVLQETWNDASGALLVYAPLETKSVKSVMAGGNSNSVKILPSGFSILPDGREKETDKNGGGCLLTLGYQFLVTSKPTSEVDQDYVKAVEELIALTIDSIKSALSIQT